MTRDERLLAEFVDCFTTLDDMIPCNIDQLSPALQAGWIDGHDRWRPTRQSTDRTMLAPLYERVPARFPQLYEMLILSYRWLNVDLHLLELLGNPPSTVSIAWLSRFVAIRYLSPC